MSSVVTGKVIRFDEARGFGFVAPDDGTEDVFLHVNDLHCDKRLITPGVRVRFAAEEGDRGLKASRVKLAEGLLSTEELSRELTEAVLADVPSLTGHQLLAVRWTFLELAREHAWICD